MEITEVFTVNKKISVLWSSEQDPIFLKFAYIGLDLGRGRSGLGRPVPPSMDACIRLDAGDFGGYFVIKGANIRDSHK